MQEPEVDQLLERFEFQSQSFSDEGEALAAVALAAEAIGKGLEGIEGEERERRLRRWLNRLQKLAAKAADEVEAVTFTVSVGIPAGASVSLTWQELGGLARSGRQFRRRRLRPAEPDGLTADRRTRSSGPRVAPAQTRPRTPGKPGPPTPQPAPEPRPHGKSSIAGPQAPIRLQPRSSGKSGRPPTDSAA